jgi:hypothetical protein
MCNAYGEKDINQIIGVPEPWSRRARFRAQEQFQNLQTSGDLKNGEFNEDSNNVFSTLVDDDDDDEAIDVAVHFIVIENCQMFAHGQKRVPIGDGTTVLLPVLTRMKPANDMWVDYKAMFDAELQQYTRISDHKFVKYTDEGKGSLFNLRIEWNDGGSSWEPMLSVVKSDPITVAAYGQANDLLENKGWRHLSKQFVKNDVAQATFTTFKGGTKMLGRTSFLQLVRVLTSGDERLITSVEYAKGILIHDNVMGLQKIIDDHLGGMFSQHQSITKELTVLGNYLKVQYKHHTDKKHSDGIACDAHGLEQGLKVAPLYQGGNRHYSAMNLSELQDLIAERKLQRPSGAQNVTKLARFLDYVDCNGIEQYNEENQSRMVGESLKKLPKDQASLECLMSSLEGMKKKQMIEVAETYNVNIPKHNALVRYRLMLQDRLQESFDQKQGACLNLKSL